MGNEQPSPTEQAETLKNYEEFVYPSGSYYFTHPDRIAIAAALAGANPTPVAGCRVLELGCSDGGNLLSMASTLPDAEFVGVDLAPLQIEMAEKTKAKAGLENVSFHAMSFTDLDSEFGEFDYIVAHGLFSWVPAHLQDELLGACARMLSPTGLAYISFNVNPGARELMWLREKLIFHVRDIEGPRAKAKAAWQFAHFIAKMQEVQSGGHHEYMKELLSTFNKILDPEAYFFHEYLETDNNPLLLSEFLAKADTSGLRYLAEACPKNRSLDGVDPGLAKVIRKFTDEPRAQEQYLDLALDTGFRRAILCRADAAVGKPLKNSLPSNWSASCHASPTEPDEDWNLCYEKSNGDRFCTDDKATQAALEKITSAWPASCPLSEIGEAIPEGGDANQLGEQASGIVHGLYRDEFIRLHISPPTIAREIPEHPKVTQLVRTTAEALHQVPTLYHSNIAMDDPVAGVVLSFLDGTRDRAQLAAALLNAVRDQKVGINVGETPLLDSADPEGVALKVIDDQLQKVLDHGLLIAP